MNVREQVGAEDKCFVFEGDDWDGEAPTLEDIKRFAIGRAGSDLADGDIRISYNGCGSHDILVEWEPVGD